jgi:Helix-hairpin-helix motif
MKMNHRLPLKMGLLFTALLFTVLGCSPISAQSSAAKPAKTWMVPRTPEKDAEAVVHYREQKGAFYSAEDLKKVPGFDSAKVEAVKNRLEF